MNYRARRFMWTSGLCLENLTIGHEASRIHSGPKDQKPLAAFVKVLLAIAKVVRVCNVHRDRLGTANMAPLPSMQSLTAIGPFQRQTTTFLQIPTFRNADAGAGLSRFLPL